MRKAESQFMKLLNKNFSGKADEIISIGYSEAIDEAEDRKARLEVNEFISRLKRYRAQNGQASFQ